MNIARKNEIFDVVGVGFGPSNLGLAVAILENDDVYNSSSPHMLFLEKMPEYNWHPGLLLPGSKLQVSFLKDLVTQRNPRSYYSFLNFLYINGRLDDFINVRDFHPLRVEFDKYLRWVSNELKGYAAYNANVSEIEPIKTKGGTVDKLRVHAMVNGEKASYDCKNVVISVGGTPRMVETSGDCNGKVVHSHSFLPDTEKYFNEKTRKYRFAVVGGGQSAAEMLLYLYKEYPESEIISIQKGFSFKQSDSSSFINEVFSNDSCSLIYEGNDFIKRVMLDKSTNYAVVDDEDINDLYSIVYTDKLNGEERIVFRRFTELVKVVSENNKAEVFLYDHGKNSTDKDYFDCVFLGTGFKRSLESDLPDGLAPYLDKKGGKSQISRCYRLKTIESFIPGIYIQGASEENHGISATLLSNIAHRSKEIADSIYGA